MKTSVQSQLSLSPSRHLAKEKATGYEPLYKLKSIAPKFGLLMGDGFNFMDSLFQPE